MLTKRPAFAISGPHSMSKAREYATYNLAPDNFSLLNSPCSSLALPTVSSDTPNYLMVAMSTLGGLQIPDNMQRIALYLILDSC
jgi:hypothetical protein